MKLDNITNPIACIVPGYCVPRNDKQSEEIVQYIDHVRAGMKDCLPSCLLIFSGGPTANTAPYLETEAEDLQTEWQKQPIASQIALEPNAICTLENILFARKILVDRGIVRGHVRVFVEDIRTERMKVICAQLLSTYQVEIVPVSLGHQADPAALEGERIGIIWIRWALASDDNLNWYQNVFAQKINDAREALKHNNTFDTVTWWQTKWVAIKEKLARDGFQL